jgi:hypothetical protein
MTSKPLAAGTLAAVAMLLAIDTSAQPRPMPLADCPTDWAGKREKRGACEDYNVSFRNACNVDIEVKICLESPKAPDGWVCGVTPVVKVNARGEFRACDATDKQRVWVKRAGDSSHRWPTFP